MEHDSNDVPMGAPHRPGADWHCRDDSEEWPCQVFKRRMWSLYQGNRPRLTEVMGGFRDKATADLNNLTAEQAETRFTGWVHDPPIRYTRRSI
ncbi:hypothetical protein OG792_21675 [Micromonospora sp. NBC_01699]|uniref:hypothetical protein n=1 Tax=Micromonospora sp. NBC_01699 TaxID=2975984 RepID=UPI002E2C1D93|nr:hypothetical protein [Micromonospora sp. NBC_01699]